MIDFSKYTNENKTVSFTNGRKAKVYSKASKKGTMYFAYAGAGSRMLRISLKSVLSGVVL